MIVMGVDGSLGSTGIAVATPEKVMALTKIRTAKTKKTPTESARLRQIYDEFSQLLRFYQPTAVVMENQHIVSQQKRKGNPKTGMSLSRVRGVIQVVCALHGIPFYLYEPTQIKKLVTGKGNASKEQVQESVIQLYQHDNLVTSTLSKIILTGKDKTDDMADALALVHAYLTAPEIAVSS